MPDPTPDLLTLARQAELLDVFYDRLSAELTPGSEATAPEFALSLRLPEAEEQDPAERRTWQYGLRVRVTTDRGTVIVEPVVTYGIPTEHAHLLQQPTLTDFANDVAVMTLLPYARQALQDLAGQVLREQIVMPSFPRGAITFPQPSEADGDAPA